MHTLIWHTQVSTKSYPFWEAALANTASVVLSAAKYVNKSSVDKYIWILQAHCIKNVRVFCLIASMDIQRFLGYNSQAWKWLHVSYIGSQNLWRKYLFKYTKPKQKAILHRDDLFIYHAVTLLTPYVYLELKINKVFRAGFVLKWFLILL